MERRTRPGGTCPPWAGPSFHFSSAQVTALSVKRERSKTRVGRETDNPRGDASTLSPLENHDHHYQDQLGGKVPIVGRRCSPCPVADAPRSDEAMRMQAHCADREAAYRIGQEPDRGSWGPPGRR